MTTATKTCPSCNNNQLDDGDPEGLCWYCRREANNKKVVQAKTISVHEVKIHPTFYSPSTRRACDSIQGWIVEGICDTYGGWFQSKKEAIAEVEDAYTAWNTDGAINRTTGFRARLKKVWGNTLASLAADEKLAAQTEAAKAKQQAEAAEQKALQTLRNAAPEMLKMLKDIVAYENDTPPDGSYGQQLYDSVRELIARVENK
jgi:hypothetical protein